MEGETEQATVLAPNAFLYKQTFGRWCGSLKDAHKIRSMAPNPHARHKTNATSLPPQSSLLNDLLLFSSKEDELSRGGAKLWQSASHL